MSAFEEFKLEIVAENIEEVIKEDNHLSPTIIKALKDRAESLRTLYHDLRLLGKCVESDIGEEEALSELKQIYS